MPHLIFIGLGIGLEVDDISTVWSYQASIKRDECVEGKITLEEFTDWLDKTKKRK